MDDTNTTQTNAELVSRVSRLNEIGAHYFAGWLVSAGFHRPEIMTAVESVLHDIENDPALRHCTLPEVATAAPIFAAERIPSPAVESPVIVAKEAPLPVAPVAPQSPLAVFPRPESKPAKRLPLSARLLAAIFPRARMAA